VTGLNAFKTGAPSRPRRIALLAGFVWLATLCMGFATMWIALATDSLQQFYALNGLALTSDELLVSRALVVAFFAVTIGFASVGALLAGRVGAGRIAALLLAGGGLFALGFFGYIVAGSLIIGEPSSTLFSALLVLGLVAIGPGYVASLPALAIAFPDGRLPSPRWRWPVGIAIAVVIIATFLELVRPGPIVGGPGNGTPNPFGIEALPSALGPASDVALIVALLGMTAFGIAAVIVRYRRGNPVERQQQRWFLSAVSLAALPLALTLGLDPGGNELPLLGAVGLMLIPIAVGVAVTRYRLYQIDHLISRTLVYVPLTALLAGLYAATVALLQRVFQSVTGDKSDAAIIISTLILASVFTPVRKWLEGIVERHFKPEVSAGDPAPATASATEGPAWDARVAAVALRVVRAEFDARALRQRPAESDVSGAESESILAP
jgi:MFS family permease